MEFGGLTTISEYDELPVGAKKVRNKKRSISVNVKRPAPKDKSECLNICKMNDTKTI